MRDMLERLELQAQACAAMGSPFTAALLEHAIADYRGGRPVRELLDAHTRYARPGLHLAGALHYLALTGEPALEQHYPSVGGDGDARAAWVAARGILVTNRKRVEQLFLRIPQTNEPARSMPLLAAFALLSAEFAMPLRILEIGASAGLNLRFDRYGYDGGTWQWGDPTSALILRNGITTGRPAHLDARIDVAERLGCDLAPLDVNREEDGLRLQSFVWPDQAERMERLRNALEIAQAFPIDVDAEDFSTWLPRMGTPSAGSVTVIVHTLVEEHLSRAARAELDATVAACAQQARFGAAFARVRMELKEGTYHTEVMTWPGSGAATEICTSDGHAQNIAWSNVT